MTAFDASVIGVSFAITAGFYLYLLIERRKLQHARKRAKTSE